ncbi:glycosyltransferase family 1 protein [candidate division KSB1 bacterium]|nr:glycosyltransferase [candidate division KSB1 bacterium]RQW07179.1 MAG: glycosyltransferase family 1 protein [candidate division KSB1 bacterium]
MKKIRVLNIQSRICIGGPSIQTELVVKYLNRQRFTPLFLGGAVDVGEAPRHKDLERSGDRIEIISEMQRSHNPANELLALYKIYRFLRQRKPHIVHTHTSKAGALGRIAAVLARTPVIIHTFHGHAFDHYFPKMQSALYVLIEKTLARFSNKIVAISALQKRDLAEVYKIAPKKKIEIIHVGHELKPFLDCVKSDELKKSLGIASVDVLIGAIGRLAPIKNFQMAIRVLATLRENGQRCHLCIAGDGAERASLEALARELNVFSYVHFLGWIQDIERIYKGIDVLVLTSLNEGTPISIIEAMASRTPVVATAVGGVPDLLQNGVNGIGCPSNDVVFMASQIECVLKDQKGTNFMCQTARAFVQSEFSHEKLIAQLERLYLSFGINK